MSFTTKIIARGDNLTGEQTDGTRGARGRVLLLKRVRCKSELGRLGNRGVDATTESDGSNEEAVAKEGHDR